MNPSESQVSSGQQANQPDIQSGQDSVPFTPIWAREKTKRPGFKMPKIELPKIDVPKLDVSKIKLPEIKPLTLPKFEGPKIDRAAIRAGFNKAAKAGLNIAASASVTNASKLAAVSIAIGAGASLAGAALIGTAAAGVASALYTYGRETWIDRQEHLKNGGTAADFKFINLNRAKKAALALACGISFGALGAWLAQSGTGGVITAAVMGSLSAATAFGTSTYQAFRSHQALNDGTKFKVFSKDRALRGVVGLAAGLGLAGLMGLMLTQDTPVPDTADADPAPQPQPDAPTADTDVVVDAQAGTPPTSEVTAAPEAAPAADVVADTVTVSSDAVAADPLAAGLTQAGLDADAGGQALKDAAHSIVRDTNINAADRVAMAHALAVEAQAQGNTQAAGFLSDLSLTAERLGVDLPGTAVTAAPVVDASPIEVLAPAHVTEVEPLVTQLPALTVTPDAVTPEVLVPAETITVEELSIAPIVTTALPPVAALAPVSDAFEAAVCQVAATGETHCQVINEEMGPGSRIAFVSAENPDYRVTTTLGVNSANVPTRGFLQETVVSDGVSRLQTLVRALIKIG